MDIALLTPIRLFGEGLAFFLLSRKEVSIITVAQNFSMLREALSLAKVDLVLIDVTQGVDLGEVHQVACQWPSVRLIAIGLKAEERGVVDCGRAGFAGYVPRDASIERLLETIEDAIAGRLNCTPEIAGGLIRALYRDTFAVAAEEGGEALTQRERDVLRELGNGISNKEIARKLGLSLSTVKHHVHNILIKLQVVRRVEAMRKVRDAPWLAGSAPLDQRPTG